MLRTLKTKLPFFYLFSRFLATSNFPNLTAVFWIVLSPGTHWLLHRCTLQVKLWEHQEPGQKGKKRLVCLPYETFALSLLSVSDSPRGFLPLSSLVNILSLSIFLLKLASLVLGWSYILGIESSSVSSHRLPPTHTPITAVLESPACPVYLNHRIHSFLDVASSPLSYKGAAESQS